MLKKRIIPIILLKNNNSIYKGKNFDSWRIVGNLINFIKIYNHREVDELIIVDVNATKNNNLIDLKIVHHVASNFNMPLTVGGGINSLEDAHKLFKNGADRICINSSAYNNIDLIQKINDTFGKQSLVVSIDYKKINGEYYCFSNSCTKNENILVIDWIKKLENVGCGEILLTSYEHEGEMDGMDEDFLNIYSDEINISIIFGGGVGNPKHAYEALKFKNVKAVTMGSIFAFTQYTPNDIKKYCKDKNIPIRL